MRSAFTAIVIALAVAAACDGGPAERPVLGCPAPDDAYGRLRDVTAASGLAFEYANPAGFQGGGLAIGDVDGDDLPDVVAARRDGNLSLWRNRGGLRFERAEDAGLDPTFAANALALSDLDNDGDRDLVVAGTAGFLLFANQGDGRFADAGVFTAVANLEHVLPVDLDGDGLLDLYAGTYDPQDPEHGGFDGVYLNRGGLAFELVTMTGPGLTWTATALDFDDDGDQDLYVANDTLIADFSDPEHPSESPLPVDLFLRNDGVDAAGVPRLTDIAADLGLTQPRSSMGGVRSDFDGDGRLDLYVPDYGVNKVFVADGGRMVDRAAALGLALPARADHGCAPGVGGAACLFLTWSAAVADFDLDGLDELVVANGDVAFGDTPPLVLLARGADLRYAPVAAGLPCTDARATIATDLDGDGDPELVVAPKDGPLSIYEDVGHPQPDAWLRVTLRGRTSNRDGVGAVVTLTTQGGRRVVRAIGAGGTIHSSAPAEAVFGLGADTIDRVDVRWPSGARTVVDSPPPGAIVVDEMP